MERKWLFPNLEVVGGWWCPCRDPGSERGAFVWVTDSCPSLCHPVDCSTLTVSQDLLRLLSIDPWHHPTISSSVVPFSSCPQSCPASVSFPMSWLFESGCPSIGASSSASVLPMNIQDGFPLEWTGWISSKSRGFSRVFSNTRVGKHQLSGAPLSLWPGVTPVYDHWRSHSFQCMGLLSAKSRLCFFRCCLGLSELFFEGASFNFWLQSPSGVIREPRK